MFSGMCDMCDGKSIEDVLRREAELMERYGWLVQMIEAEQPERSWAYSVGLSANFGRPDLLVRNIDAARAGRMVTIVGEMVAEGGGLDEAELAQRGWFLFDVDPATLEPHQVGGWENLARRSVRAGDFLEIVSLGRPRGMLRPALGYRHPTMRGRRPRP